MCGIFGGVNLEGRSASPLFDVNVQRGRDAWGCSAAQFDRRNYAGWDTRVEIPFTKEPFVANCRAEPTTERIVNPTWHDIQPYTVGDWTIVHNGTIANDKQIIVDYGFNPPTEVDSWIVAALCDRVGFNMMLQVIIGSYAILAWHKDDNKLFYAVNYRPLYQIFTGDYRGRVLSSVPLSSMDVPISQYTSGFISSDENLLNGPNIAYPVIDRRRVLAVCSGGLDSTVAAHWAIREGYDVTLLHFDYGCRATWAERHAVEDISDHLNVPLRVIPTPLFTDFIKGSKLTDDKSKLGLATATVASGVEGAEYAHEWVPARNLIMLSIAVGYAESHGFDYITLGANLEEAGAYPDNEPEFLKRFEHLLPLATGDGRRLGLLTPVGNLMKHEIVKLGLELGTPMELTWSCYENGEQHCGNCGPCFMRRTAFEINGATDPVFKER